MMSMAHMVLWYKGNELPPEVDLFEIHNSGAKIINKNEPGAIELETSPEHARKLKSLLPDWEMSLVGYYGIPELGLPIEPMSPMQTKGIAEGTLLQIADDIRQYVKEKGGRTTLANIASVLRKKGVKPPHILEAIRKTHVLNEDGQTVWIEEK